MPLDDATRLRTASPRNWFGVGVRLIGLWEIVSGLEEGVTYANVIMNLFGPTLTSANGYLVGAIARLMIGLFLLLSATAIANMIYPTEGNAPAPPSTPAE